jgi:hypothetical protein
MLGACNYRVRLYGKSDFERQTVPETFDLKVRPAFLDSGDCFDSPAIDTVRYQSV